MKSKLFFFDSYHKMNDESLFKRRILNEGVIDEDNIYPWLIILISCILFVIGLIPMCISYINPNLKFKRAQTCKQKQLTNIQCNTRIPITVAQKETSNLKKGVSRREYFSRV